jgi:hypothetical protein
MFNSGLGPWFFTSLLCSLCAAWSRHFLPIVQVDHENSWQPGPWEVPIGSPRMSHRSRWASIDCVEPRICPTNTRGSFLAANFALISWNWIVNDWYLGDPCETISHHEGRHIIFHAGKLWYLWQRNTSATKSILCCSYNIVSEKSDLEVPAALHLTL